MACCGNIFYCIPGVTGYSRCHHPWRSRFVFLAVLTGHGATQLSTALLMAFLGAVSGDGLSFWLGKHFKDRIHHIWPFSRYPKVLQSGTRFFETHGGKSVIIGRFIGPIRPIIPMVAGALNMSAKRFFIYNASSAIVWAPMYVLPGFLVGASLQLDVKLPPLLPYSTGIHNSHCRNSAT